MNEQWKKARKKPVVVEFRDVQAKSLIRVRHFEDGSKKEVWGEVIETRVKGELESVKYAYPDTDFIMRGVKGEIYPIEKEIFYETYEVLDE